MALRKEETMSNPIPFDTLAFAKKSEARGVDNKQAEAHAEVLAEVLEASFTSKKDSTYAIDNLTHEITNFRNDITHEIANLRNDLTHETTNLRHEMNVKFAEVKSEVIKWVFGISFAQAALIISVLKFFH